MAIDGIYGIQIHEGRWNSESITKFGFNNDVATSDETLWDQGGTYTYLTSASVLKISSSSANDDATGTGARTVKVFGVDADYNEISETVTMDGQTGVDTSNSFLRVFRMIVITAGTGGKNAGDVYAGTGTISSGVPANKFAKILVGNNQTLMTNWTTPVGYNSYLTSIDISSGSTAANKFVTAKLIIRPLNEVFQTKQIFTLHNSTVHYDFGVPLKLAPKTDIEIVAKTSSSTDAVSGSYNIIYKKIT